MLVGKERFLGRAGMGLLSRGEERGGGKERRGPFGPPANGKPVAPGREEKAQSSAGGLLSRRHG